MKMINLLPQEYIRQTKIRNYMTVGVALIILECIGATCIAIEPFLEIQKENAKRVQVERKLSNEAFEEVREINKALDTAQKDVQTWENNIATMGKDTFVSTALLDAVLSNVPAGVTINILDIQQETQAIQIEGRTTNHFTVMGYISHLQSIYPMAKVTFEIGESEDKSIYRNFNIAIELPLPEGVTPQEGAEVPQGEAEVPKEGAEVLSEEGGVVNE